MPTNSITSEDEYNEVEIVDKIPTARRQSGTSIDHHYKSNFKESKESRETKYLGQAQMQGPNQDNADATSTVNTNTKPVEWSPENEDIMIEWCDVAQCYKWLNTQAYAKYSYRHAWFTIPAITLSTISGTASFAQASLPLEYQSFAPMVIGTINIFIGILTTIQQYLKISELNEAHRVAAISWDKFARNIRIELAKRPEERMDAGQFLKISRQEFDRLMETSPMVGPDIIKQFNDTFKGEEGSVERRHFDALKKPDICNILISANETRHKWYLELNKTIDDFDTPTTSLDDEAHKLKDSLIRSQQEQLKHAISELNRKREEEINKIRQHELDRILSQKKAQDEKQRYDDEVLKIYKYVAEFETLYSRKPYKDEIISNMAELVDSDIMTKYMNLNYAEDNV